MLRQDFLKRQIEAFARALAAMAGLRKAGRAEEALELGKEASGALGLDRGLLRLDDASVASLLGSSDKVRALADLLDEEAACRSALGDVDAALALTRRAARLRDLSTK